MFSPPVVAGRSVYVANCRGRIEALDAESGQVRWTYDARQDGGRPEFHGRALLTEELLLIASDDRRAEGTGHVYALERATGEIRWKYGAGRGAMTNVVRHGPRAYVVTVDEELVCLDLANGRVVWKFATGSANDEYFMTSSPAVAGERVFFGAVNGNVYALDARTGARLWTREIGARISTAVTAVGEKLYCGAADERVYCLDQAGGDVLGELAVEAVPVGEPTPAGEALLIVPSRDRVICLDRALQEVLWTGTANSNWRTHRPSVWGATLLAGNNDGEVVAFRLADGSREWSYNFTDQVTSLNRSGEVLLVGTQKGPVYACTPTH